MLRFEDWFWGPEGVRVLHDHFQMGIAELEELVAFLNQRITIEDQYGSRLTDLSRIKAEADGFAKDDSLISQIFGNAKQEMASLGAAHKRVSEMIAELVHPLQRFLDDNRKLSLTKKDQIEATKKKLDKQRGETEAAKTAYFGKLEAAEEEERHQHERASEGLHEDAAPGLDSIMSVGPRSFTKTEYNELLRNLQHGVKSQDVKTILGVYKGCVTPGDVIATLTSFLNLSAESANEMFAALVTQSVLRPISRTTKFSSPTTYYQWKLPTIPAEPTPQSLRADSTRAEIAYLSSIKSAEATRLSLEGMCIDYFNSLQHVETVKIALFKESMSGLNETQKNVVESGRVVCEQGSVWVEMVDPKKEVEYFVERARTGNRREGAVVREERNGAKLGIFGVSLEELAARDHRTVPKLIRKALRALREGSQADSGHAEMQEIDLWLDTNMSYTAIHTLRQQLNDKTLTAKFLRRKATPHVLVGLIKSFLVELPVSVCGEEVYEEVKMVYLSKTDDLVDMRLKSLKSLLATLSPSHFDTLRAIAGHWHRTMENLDQNDKKLSDLAGLLGPYVLRPKAESRLTLHDKHPARLVKDLILHFRDVFSPSTPPSITDPNGPPLYIPDVDDSDSAPETDSMDETESEAAGDDLETASVTSGRSRLSLQLPSFAFSGAGGRDSTTSSVSSSTGAGSGASTPTGTGKRGSLQLAGFSLPGLISSTSSTSLASSSASGGGGKRDSVGSSTTGSGRVTPTENGPSSAPGSKRASLTIDTTALYERSANLFSGVGGMFRKGDAGAVKVDEEGKKREKEKEGRGSFSDVSVEASDMGHLDVDRNEISGSVTPVSDAADLKDAYIEDLQSPGGTMLALPKGKNDPLGLGFDNSPLEFGEYDSDDELDVDVRADGVVVS
ncbi:hypothetical protein HDV00_005577, partial [Rhizophlyctis rosea]